MKKHQDFSDIDIISLLDFYDIEYRTSGKNIGTGWLGLESCPFCGAGGYHLGVHLDSKVHSCFVCGQKGSLPKLLKSLLGLDYFELQAIFNKFGGNFKEVEEVETSKKVIFPTRLTNLGSSAKKYLISRGYSPTYLTKTYGLKQTGILSKLQYSTQAWEIKHRIICPIIMDNKIVSWSGRDFTGKSGVRWKHCPNTLSEKPIADILYNIDNVKQDKVILVEGITDVWAMGDGSVGMMGVKFSEGQIYELVQRKFKEIIILFDASADEPAKKLAHTLSPFTKVRVDTLFVGDPGDLNETEAAKLKYYLLGSHYDY